MIWAEDSKRAIGKNQSIPWRIPDDMAFFKKTTTDNTVIMGRKTFDSIGKALPNRQNIVLTHRLASLPEDVTGIQSFEELEKLTKANPETKFYIIGGAFLYNHLLNQADELLITRVHGDFNGDVFAPVIPADHFELVSSHRVPKEDQIPEHTFEVWKRVNN